LVIDYVAKQIWKGIALAGLIGAIILAYQTWFPRKVSTFVYTNGNWMQGEKKDGMPISGEQPPQLDCTIKIRERDTEPHDFDGLLHGSRCE
jgi:hypothetical protein